MRINSSDGLSFDFCKRCFPTESWAIRKYGSRGDGPDERGNCFSYNDDHPDYEEDGIGSYKCKTCKRALRECDS